MTIQTKNNYAKHKGIEIQPGDQKEPPMSPPGIKTPISISHLIHSIKP